VLEHNRMGDTLYKSDLPFAVFSSLSFGQRTVTLVLGMPWSW
jgi:hypothetical protein